MEKFDVHIGVAAPLLRANVDTDAIIPSREMKKVSRLGLGEGLFASWRYLEPDSRDPNTDFVLNQSAYEDASILLSGPNFGCGSSREHAVWALKEYGIRAILAPDFGAIFANNCVRNGLLPVVLPASTIAVIARWVENSPERNRVSIDLPAQVVTAQGERYAFDLDPEDKMMLVQGLDAIALTQTRWQVIEAFHHRRRQARPWLY